MSVDANATAVVSGPVTDGQGVVTADIGIGGDGTLRPITVTATSGGITRTATLTVTNVPTTTGPVASDLTLTLSSRALDNGGTNTIRATATAVDANRNALPGIPVTIQVDASAVAQVSGTATDAQGRVTADVGIGADRSNRTVTVTATSGTLTRTASFQVQGAKITASFQPQVNTGTTGNRIDYTLIDTNALPMADVSYTVSAQDGTSKTGRTDANGKFFFVYRAPGTAGNFVVTASAAGATLDSLVAISSSSIPDVSADLVDISGSLTPTPSVVSVNSSSASENQIELRALFVGRNQTSGQDNVPVPNVRARFQILNNQDGSLGSVSWVGGDYAIADANGVARATYRPGARSSPTNGVTLRACWDRVDFPTTSCPNPTTATVTVVDEALSVNIRTNELIKSGAAELTYIKEFVVMVVDAAGNARADVQITPSVDLTGYYKGFYWWDGEAWVQQLTLANTEAYRWNGTGWVPVGGTTGRPVCPNEDINRNGIRDAASYDAGTTAPGLGNPRREDMNWNGELDPRKADVAVKMVGSPKTDANGIAIVQIEYGRDLATWVDFVITVTASGISGTEARARYTGNLYGLGNLPAPGEAFRNEDVAPAFVVSPYGRGDYDTSAALPLGFADRLALCTDAEQ